MSLHEPQAKSLKIFSDYLQSSAGQRLLSRMKKDSREPVELLLTESKAYFEDIPEAKEFIEFERSFPAYTFALATGTGKTRLMGAFLTYLYLVYNIQHFLIVAPNLTIYRKLQDDFSKANNPKYVFKGIQEININTTKIITTENYASQSGRTLFGNQIEINIFNIQQFAQKDMTSERGITKAWESAGESYFDYLKSREDLVVMLDEAHHYHADAALSALDTLDPLFGLEMTATPYLGTQGTGRNARQIKMKNVLYSYNLGDAIRGELVKDPWVGTEADVDFSQYDQDAIETDARKLQLACFFHERAKIALQEYALENNKKKVKPVMLVVAKDIDHSNKLKVFIDSEDFRGGEFRGKVIEINTRQRGEESDDNIEKLISLEHPDNTVEIVIHVNMLKEGWDVTNVYTIVPLRASAALILTEQTIGRGLRLPYGERTGVPLVDRLVIVAHEQYAAVVALAQNLELIQGVEKVNEAETQVIKKCSEVQPIVLDVVQDEITQNTIVMKEVQKKAEELIAKLYKIEEIETDVRETFIENKKNELVKELSREATKNLTFSSFHNQQRGVSTEVPFSADTLFGSFSREAKDELKKISQKSGLAMEKRNIPIPRLLLTPHFGELEITQFDLDISVLQTYTNERAILEEQLQGDRGKNLFNEDVPGRRKSEVTKITDFGAHIRQTPQSTIIAALLDFPLIDYDDNNQKKLLLKLAEQVVSHYRKKSIDENNLALIIESNARSIGEEIYKQIISHTELKSEGYLESDIKEPKPYLEQYNITESPGEKVVSLDSQLNTFSARMLYGQFRKACHSKYRFDSSDEVRLAYLLDKDELVEDWLRPAPNQFEGLYWRDEDGDSQHRYEPDFVVELNDRIVMVEVKPAQELNSPSVQAKKITAEKYCEVVNRNTGKFGIVKPWFYVIITTERISIQSTVEALLKV